MELFQVKWQAKSSILHLQAVERLLLRPTLQKHPSQLMASIMSSIQAWPSNLHTTPSLVWTDFKSCLSHKLKQNNVLVVQVVQDPENASDFTLKQPFNQRC